MDAYCNYCVYFSSFNMIVNPLEFKCVEFRVDGEVTSDSQELHMFCYMYLNFKKNKPYKRGKLHNLHVVLFTKQKIYELHEQAFDHAMIAYSPYLPLLKPGDSKCYYNQNYFIKCAPFNTLSSTMNELAINHMRIPGVSQCIHVEILVDSFCMVFPHYGHTLYDEKERLLNDDTFLLNTCLKLSHTIARLHDLRIAHLDLKPANLCMDSQQNITVCDFGLSFRCFSTDRLPTLRVSPAYRPPELFITRAYDAYNPLAVDIWSFGMIMWEWISGTLVIGEPLYALQALEAWRESPREIESKSDVRQKLRFTVLEMLNWNPEHRPVASVVYTQLACLTENAARLELCDRMYITPQERTWRCEWKPQLISKNILANELYLRYSYQKRKLEHGIPLETFITLADHLEYPSSDKMVTSECLEVATTLHYQLYLENTLTKYFGVYDAIQIQEMYLNFGWKGMTNNSGDYD